MPNPSNYLETTQKRFQDRGFLVRRDIEIMLEGLSGKGAFLDDLRKQTLKHRGEDALQLTEARRAIWASWEERLRRLEEWMREAAELKRSSGTLVHWRVSARGFERLQTLAEKYTAGLVRRARAMGDEIYTLAGSIHEWDQRLCVKEADIRAFIDRQAAKTTELMVSKARKQPFLDFLYIEREEEGRLSRRMKSIRSTTNTTLDRLGRAQQWVVERATQDPDSFGKRKDAFVENLKPFHKQFADLRERALEQALIFEGGRQRLRWIYEQVQRMRVVQDAPTARTPLIERFFGNKE